MITKTVTLINKLGIHVRPASLISKKASKYKSNFMIRKDDMEINGKSVMGIMMLGAGLGTELELFFDGVDEQEMMEEIVELFADKFGEE
ncbi:MAG TPA: HPr family phosphocarrier protein [Candidatus Cloacimonetes bacterium]|nr:HPr family phosphocarrier protein [Candidatus Cloacimonadota bacterium]HHE40019.1 HPr family phosphocarrier protein [Candidatus Cloacimonadota bacterium]